MPFVLATPAASKEAQDADAATLLREINVHVRRDIGGIATVSGLVKGKLPKTVRVALSDCADSSSDPARRSAARSAR